MSLACSSFENFRRGGSVRREVTSLQKVDSFFASLSKYMRS